MCRADQFKSRVLGRVIKESREGNRQRFPFARLDGDSDFEMKIARGRSSLLKAFRNFFRLFVSSPLEKLPAVRAGKVRVAFHQERMGAHNANQLFSVSQI